MLFLQRLYLILFVISTPLAFALKIQTTPPLETQDTTPSVLTQHLKKQGVFLYVTLAPVNRGNFPIHIYRGTDCIGEIAIILLDKNAEGAAILAHHFQGYTPKIHFIHAGKRTSYFPAFQYWLNRSLNLFWDFSQGALSQTHVLGVTETGSCSLISRLNWSEI